MFEQKRRYSGRHRNTLYLHWWSLRVQPCLAVAQRLRHKLSSKPERDSHKPTWEPPWTRHNRPRHSLLQSSRTSTLRKGPSKRNIRLSLQRPCRLGTSCDGRQLDWIFFRHAWNNRNSEHRHRSLSVDYSNGIPFYLDRLCGWNDWRQRPHDGWFVVSSAATMVGSFSPPDAGGVVTLSGYLKILQ